MSHKPDILCCGLGYDLAGTPDLT